MSPWQAIVLGLVEGVTEFLPVSSTGHLILAQHVLGLPDTPAVHAFEICIQSGAIAAVLTVFLPRCRQMLRGLLGLHAGGLRLLGLLVLAFVPTVIAALLLKPIIERHLFGLWPVVAAWAVGGAAILLIPLLRSGPTQAGRELEELDSRRALGVGAFQCLALWPGTSRSLATIGGGLGLGLSGAAAVEFSLLLGLLTLGAATAQQAHEHGLAMLRELGLANLALGFLSAFLSARIAVRGLVRMLARGGLWVFGWYRLALAALVALALVYGLLEA